MRHYRLKINQIVSNGFIHLWVCLLIFHHNRLEPRQLVLVLADKTLTWKFSAILIIDERTQSCGKWPSSKRLPRFPFAYDRLGVHTRLVAAHERLLRKYNAWTFKPIAYFLSEFTWTLRLLSSNSLNICFYSISLGSKKINPCTGRLSSCFKNKFIENFSLSCFKIFLFKWKQFSGSLTTLL